MAYYFPFGQELHPVVQTDRSPKKVFVLGVYASAVHARWINPAKSKRPICNALAVASEPRIFWDGNEDEAREIIEKIPFPKELGRLEPAVIRKKDGTVINLNGPSAKALDENILVPLGFTRKDSWLCDLLPEARLNAGQVKAIKRAYEPIRTQYSLNEVTVPNRPNAFCNKIRCREIIAELMQSEAELLVLLGDIPIKQFLKKAADISYASLQEYVDMFGYGTRTEAVINGRKLQVLPLAHPRWIAGMDGPDGKWTKIHNEWENSLK